ncbi:uncharacterized protein LOC128878199 isoform X1 [Hylaeus volcanicus]|uniref:uncharacterized protein LOC128878199 isoform X1 n=1 Tax=Hylaeus volcanicus TaxID=313075 RepID=UPI0023B84C9E|nr:uncharacterized protein LOC128878199 isoform X1 [Hylaeus volcanicus]
MFFTYMKKYIKASEKKNSICKDTDTTISSICEKPREKDSVCTDTKSNISSICDNKISTSSTCVCMKGIQKYKMPYNVCLKAEQELSETSSLSSSNLKQIFTEVHCTSPKLIHSYEEQMHCTPDQEEVDIYNFDLIEAHPREEPQIRTKDLAPPGHNITLILPESNNKLETSFDSLSICDDKSENINDLTYTHSTLELFWNVLHYGMNKKIPEKYTTDLFQVKTEESSCSCPNILYNSKDYKNVFPDINTCTMCCSHEVSRNKVKIIYSCIYFI